MNSFSKLVKESVGWRKLVLKVCYSISGSPLASTSRMNLTVEINSSKQVLSNSTPNLKMNLQGSSSHTSISLFLSFRSILSLIC